MAKPWSEVEQSQAYQALLPEQKMAAKQQYFNEVVSVKPEYMSLSPANQNAARAEFFGGVSPIDTRLTTPGLRPISLGKNGKPIYDPFAFKQAEQNMKIGYEGNVAAAKERETAISKAGRLEIVGNRVKDEWLKTSPYRGAITKTGMVPLLGAWDILKKGLGATNAQQQDQAYSDFIQGIRAQLARGMGDVGNLSEYEQRAVIRLVPNLRDSYELGMNKLGKLSALVADIRSTRGGEKEATYQEFSIGGTSYRIPKDKVEAFKKAKGL